MVSNQNSSDEEDSIDNTKPKNKHIKKVEQEFLNSLPPELIKYYKKFAKKPKRKQIITQESDNSDNEITSEEDNSSSE